MKKQLFIIILATVLSYLNIFNNQLAIDDHIFVGKYHPSVIESFSGAVPLGHEGVYRPIRGVFYTIYNQLWGANPIGYHLNSLLVHLASTILIYFIVKKIAVKVENLPFLTALFFGLHPVHTETITYIASGMDAIGLMFLLVSFYLYLRNKTAPSIIFAVLAFFTSEMTLVLPILIIFHDWIFNKLAKKHFGIYSLYILPAIAYVTIRFMALDITTRGPYLANSFYLTMLTMTKVLMQYLKVLLWPVNLVNNHIISNGIEAFVYRNYQTAAIANQSIFDLPILLSTAILSFLIYLIFKLKKNYPLISFSIGWFFITLLPVMEFVPQGSMMNERSLYLASFGFILILAIALIRLKKLGITVTILIALFYGGQTYLRNRDWHDDITLWQVDVKTNPNENAYARFALGNAYNDRKDYQKAINEYTKSVEINTGFAVGWASLGRTYADMGDLPNAIINYKHALEIDPNFWEVKNNLNNIYKQL